MLSGIPKALWSMLLSSKRMRGRGWGTELLARLLRDLFARAARNGPLWLRQEMDKAGSTVRIKVSDNVTEEKIAGVRCLLTEVSVLRDSTPETVVVYLHGGGFIAGSPQGFQNLISQLAHHSQALFIAVDYRLSPEHVFPAAQDDCLAVVKEVLIRYSQSKIIIAGDSAGGNLAISTALSLANDGSQQRDVAGLLLISPWVDPTANTGSIQGNANNDILLEPFLGDSYLKHIGQAEHNDPRVNFATCDLSSLPQTYVQLAGGELFIDQVVAFCDRAQTQGVSLELKVYPGQFHDFQTLSPLLKDAKLAVQDMAKYIKSV